ncbi:MAG: hypothetical protein ACPGYK_03960 [Flavobacteriales bacterium]
MDLDCDVMPVAFDMGAFCVLESGTSSASGSLDGWSRLLCVNVGNMSASCEPMNEGLSESSVNN